MIKGITRVLGVLGMFAGSAILPTRGATTILGPQVVAAQEIVQGECKIEYDGGGTAHCHESGVGCHAS